MELLDLFSPDRAEIGLTDFVRLSKRDKATVHRHLTELAQNGFLEQNPDSRAYRLGPAVLRLAALRETLFPMRKILQPLVIELSEIVGELAHASLLQNDEMSPLVHADPKVHGIQVHFDVAEMLPLHATSSGLAALAFFPDATIDRLMARPLKKHTARTVADPSRMRDLIEGVRQYGLCTLADAFEDGVSSVGAPIFGQGCRVIGALAVAVPTSRAAPRKTHEIAGQLQRYARKATVALGGAYPKTFEDLPPNWSGTKFTVHRESKETEPNA
ncbi:IclR family transcriptional regulator [Sulfitobacter albidus]|uniref:IclR family transcriptional regulator n=1 Tax=Sulfitobacter albidus TaxID=2829501 RepID=UPI0020C89C58|nr:IclR family transcriptional regulator [Sulfitobacter albidus]